MSSNVRFCNITSFVHGSSYKFHLQTLHLFRYSENPLLQLLSSMHQQYFQNYVLQETIQFLYNKFNKFRGIYLCIYIPDEQVLIPYPVFRLLFDSYPCCLSVYLNNYAIQDKCSIMENSYL